MQRQGILRPFLPAGRTASASIGATANRSTPGRDDSTRPGEARAAEVTTEAGARATRAPGDRVRVLIVDDSEDQLHLLRRHFELAGCEVLVAATAESAIARYEGDLPDLAVIDLMLPGMNGWELTERIQDEHPEIPVAITSVLDRKDFPDADAALPKPVTRETVRQVLRSCVPRWVAP